MESGFMTEEGEVIIVQKEISLGETTEESWWLKLLKKIPVVGNFCCCCGKTREGSRFEIVTNKKLVIIDKSVCGADESVSMRYLTFKSVIDFGITAGKWETATCGCCCKEMHEGGAFYINTTEHLFEFVTGNMADSLKVANAFSASITK